ELIWFAVVRAHRFRRRNSGAADVAGQDPAALGLTRAVGQRGGTGLDADRGLRRGPRGRQVDVPVPLECASKDAV
ncbi:MAG TPA: hypothetical protein VGH89_19910, partial [Pseudonocardia sp.]